MYVFFICFVSFTNLSLERKVPGFITHVANTLLERWAAPWTPARGGFHQNDHKRRGRTPMRGESTPLVIQPAPW